MEASRKLIIGYDLCEDFSQISCYSYKKNEPLSVNIGDGDDNDCPIPTVLCVKKDTKQWLFGNEAIECAKKGEGFLLDQLLAKARTNETIEIYQTQFSGVTLLEKYLRKTLNLVKKYFPTEQITKLVVTIHKTEPDLVEKIYDALALLGIDKDRAIVLSHASAYMYYALCQDRTFWMNDIGLFDYNNEGLQYYQIHINRKANPMLAGLFKKDFSEEMGYELIKKNKANIAYIFENIANTALYKKIVSTLYFTGRGFSEEWAEETIKKLCTGRRVFMGQNLFAKGACYASKELSGDPILTDLKLYNDDMVTSIVSIRVYCDTKFKEIPLVEAGEIWYEVNKSIEAIPEGNLELDVTLSNIMTRDSVHERLILSKIPKRPDKTTRLAISFTCKNRDIGVIKVKDLGFGEFYPGTGEEMVFSLEI